MDLHRPPVAGDDEISHAWDRCTQQERHFDSCAAHLAPDASVVCIEHQAYCGTNPFANTHRPSENPCRPATSLEYYDYPQYSFHIVNSPTFFEDAQYLLGPHANFDDHQENLASTSSSHNNVEDYGNHPFMPLEQLMSIGTSEDVFPAPALTQDQTIGVAPPVIAAAPQPSGQANLTCPIGCEATFSRPGEYRRHMKKHGARSLPCTRPGCSMLFYRKDKLRDHLRQGHNIVQQG